MSISLDYVRTADLITQLQLGLNLVTLLRASAIRTLLALHGPLRLLWYVKRRSDSFTRVAHLLPLVVLRLWHWSFGPAVDQ